MAKRSYRGKGRKTSYGKGRKQIKTYTVARGGVRL